MAMPVLATKLFVPPPRASAVPRARLVEQLHEGLRAGRALALVSAPAGFGKTSLVSEWVAQAQHRDPQLGVAWLSLDEADNDSPRFVGYLLAALNRADPSLDAESIDPTQPPAEAIAALINRAVEGSRELIVVLDDFHLIEEPSIRDAVAVLIDNLPPRIHLTIASRSDPLLPLARLRARGELTELRAADLRFSPEEVAEFLAQSTGLTLSSADVAALESRTEGWIAGLQLAALSMRDRADIPGFISAFTGSNRFVIDYLIEEVLHQAPLDVREFLCQTAILDRMNGPVCDAVTGQSGGAQMLESLERANVFIVPLDDRREWYRYHHLFADVLRSRLTAHGADHAAALHERASEWFEANGSLDEAVGHAFAANDIPRAARLIEASIPEVRRSRQDAPLIRRLGMLPPETVRRMPVLSMFLGWASLVSGDIDAVEPWLDNAERLLALTNDDGTPAHESLDGETLRSVPVTVALYRAAVAQARGDLPAMATFARRALELTVPDDHLGRGAAAGMLGLAEAARGELEAGVTAFAEARINLRLAGNYTDALTTTLVVADMLVPLGRPTEARSALEAALATAIDEGRGASPAADLHSGVAQILVDLGDVEGAARHLAAAESLGEAGFSHEHRYRWYTAMAGVARAEGRLVDALELLDSAAGLYRRGFFPDIRPIPAQRARVWIEQGRLDAAQEWANTEGLASTDEPSFLREYDHATLAMLLIAQGRDEASELLDRLLIAAQSAGRAGTVAEVQRLRELAQSPNRMGQTAVPGTTPKVVLSDRELQVLRLLASELSGPDIARELYISINTMRTHTKHIFEKLDVTSRTAAVRRATSAGLI